MKYFLLPIGNLTSQFFANLYLNELDQYVKHTLKCKYYLRYCDDFLLLDNSKHKLYKFKCEIEKFVGDKLKLELNEKYGQVLPVTNGIDFLGYIIRRDYLLVRRRVIVALKQKMDQFEKDLVRYENIMGNAVIIYLYKYDVLEQLRAVFASYMGHIAKADSYRLRLSLLKKYSFLKEYFDQRIFLAKNSLGKLVPLFDYPKFFGSVKRQYNYFAKKFADCVLFFQVGLYVEFYAKPTDGVIQLLNLKPLKPRLRGALYGFPVHLAKDYLAKLLNADIKVVVIRENGRCYTRTIQRLPVKKFIKKESLNG